MCNRFSRQMMGMQRKRMLDHFLGGFLLLFLVGVASTSFLAFIYVLKLAYRIVFVW